MDALDAAILRELGFEPFVGWEQRPRGLKASDVARHLGVNVRLVQDRITRMEADGIIAGYGIFPNPRLCNLDLTTFHFLAHEVPDEQSLARLDAVDGFVSVVPFLGSGLCLTVSHATAAQCSRRVAVIDQLIDAERKPLVLYHHALPAVTRRLDPLDWRLIAALAPDARLPIAAVADELGITVKTARTRLSRMREEGSIDEYVRPNFERMTGIMPFELAVWMDNRGTEADPGAVEKRLLSLFQERYLAHFVAPPGGYCDRVLRIWAYTPAEVQSLVRQAMDLPGVQRAEALMAAGFHFNVGWLQELLADQIATASAPVP